MPDDLLHADSFHLIVKLKPGMLPGWEGGGWVGLESFAEEHLARDRFHALRPVLEALQARAAMIRGLAQSATQTISHDKTVISRDAEFWTLGSVEIRVAGPELLGLWRREADRLTAEFAAREAARQAARPVVLPPPPPPTGLSKRSAALLFGGSFVAVLVASKLLMTPPPDPAVSITTVKRDGTTIMLPDPKDPNFTIEYELRPDGTRVVTARYPNGQRPEPQDPNDPKRQRSLADGVNNVLRARP